MSKCSDCGQPTLTDGVCTACSDKRFDMYPRLKEIIDRLEYKIGFLENQRIGISNHYDQAVPQYSELNLNKALILTLYEILGKEK